MIGRKPLPFKNGSGYAPAMDAVDLALVIALDGSASVTFEEFNLIAGGLAAALRHPGVVAGLTGGPLRASLGAVLLFSGRDAQHEAVDWTRLDSAAAVDRFAQAVQNGPRLGPPGLTALGGALLAAATLLGRAPAPARRQVIDIAGDGRSNDGPAPGPIRDVLASSGITINGLAVLHEEPDLVASYTAQIMGGPGAFVLHCQDYASFAEAMRQKLQQEIS